MAGSDTAALVLSLIVFLAVAIVAALSVILIFRAGQAIFHGSSASPNAGNDEPSDPTACQDPGCVRCCNYRGLTLTAVDRLARHRERLDTGARQKLEAITRAVATAADSRADSGRTKRQKPTVLMIPWLSSEPYPRLPAIEAALNRPGVLEAVLAEFETVGRGHQAMPWRCNSATAGVGAWKVLHLVNQGIWIDEVCKKFPRTAATLTAVSSFMGQGAFGNAFFSVLEPGTKITPHFGPSNCRLRVHFPLKLPVGAKAELLVDGRAAEWEVGKALVIDDSLLHSASYSGADLEAEDGSSDRSRVVLIIDVWHPELLPEEREAIARAYDLVNT